ncbi:MAG: ATP-binding protein [Erysipelotrichaceae bacterium]
MISNQNEVKKKNKITKIILASLLCIILVVGSVISFIISYEKMQKTAALEREQYVSELTEQVVAKVNATIDNKHNEVKNYANLINQARPDSFVKAEAIFQGMEEKKIEDKILFLSKQGNVYLLDGTTIRINDLKFLSSISSNYKVSSTFSQLGDLGDYWLFGEQIQPIEIDGISMTAIIRANKNTSFAKEMTVSMFDNQGYSFIISNSSSILIKPDNAYSYGSNLMNSLSYSGLSEIEKQRISENIANHKQQSVFFDINKQQWLLQTAYVRGEYSVAVLLPLQMMSSGTIMVMNQTMLLYGLVLIIAIISVVSIIMVKIKSKQEKRRNEEKFQEDLLLKTAQNKTDFLSKMSHDIRTPLNGIIGMTYLASDNLENKAALEDNLSKIQASADYLLSLVNDILDMSKIDSGKLKLNYESVNIELILENIVSLFEVEIMQKKIKVIIDGVNDLPVSYKIDKLRINQVLMNLLSNAVKFTPCEGEIYLSLNIIPLTYQRDRIVFTVKDNGVGMSEEFMSRIFKSFEQESNNTSQYYGGSGLGLAIVKRLMDLMGGAVSVESTLGGGTTFTVVVSLEKTEKCEDHKLPKINKTISKDSIKRLAGKHVLLVEDHPINAQIATKILEKWGFEVTVAENGEVGVNQFNSSQPGFYSVIFMDIKMPILNGYEATKQIRLSEHSDAKTIPIYAMSANAFDDDVQKSLEVGMNGHLRKPIEMPELIKIIEENIL